MLKKMFQISEINKKGAWIALLATVIHRNKIMLFINGYNCYKFQIFKLYSSQKNLQFQLCLSIMFNTFGEYLGENCRGDAFENFMEDTYISQDLPEVILEDEDIDQLFVMFFQ